MLFIIYIIYVYTWTYFKMGTILGWIWIEKLATLLYECFLCFGKVSQIGHQVLPDMWIKTHIVQLPSVCMPWNLVHYMKSAGRFFGASTGADDGWGLCWFERTSQTCDFSISKKESRLLHIRNTTPPKTAFCSTKPPKTAQNQSKSNEITENNLEPRKIT